MTFSSEAVLKASSLRLMSFCSRAFSSMNLRSIFTTVSLCRSSSSFFSRFRSSSSFSSTSLCSANCVSSLTLSPSRWFSTAIFVSVCSSSFSSTLILASNTSSA